MSDEETIKRIDDFCREGQLIALALNLLEYSQADVGRFAGWRAGVLTFLRDLLPSGHTYLQEFQKTINEEHPANSNVYGGVEILRRLKDDISRGYLLGFKAQITAGVFADFVEMSRYLYKNEFYAPAVSVSSAVLEDGLRRILANKGKTIGINEALGSLNDLCLSEGVYTKLEHNKIDRFRIIRNDVDHGRFEEFETNVGRKEIKAMIDDIERILATYLK